MDKMQEHFETELEEICPVCGKGTLLLPFDKVEELDRIHTKLDNYRIAFLENGYTEEQVKEMMSDAISAYRRALTERPQHNVQEGPENSSMSF